MAGGSGEAGGLDGGVARVFAAISGASVGNDDTDSGFGNVKGVGDLGADGERPLRAGPDGHSVVAPFGDGGARLERSVGDVGDGVGGFEPVRGSGKAVGDRALLGF